MNNGLINAQWLLILASLAKLEREGGGGVETKHNIIFKII